MENYWLNIDGDFLNMNDIHKYQITHEYYAQAKYSIYYVQATVRSVSSKDKHTIMQTTNKDEALQCLRDIMNGDSRYVSRIGNNSSEIDALKKQIEELTMMIKLMPGGFMAQEAKKDISAINL